MGLPVVAGDLGVGYVFPSIPPVVANFPMVFGSAKVFIHGKSIMLLGQAETAAGPIALATLFTLKVFVEGKPVLLGGAVTTLSTGWVGGVLQPAGAANVFMT